MFMGNILRVICFFKGQGTVETSGFLIFDRNAGRNREEIDGGVIRLDYLHSTAMMYLV